MVNYYEVLEIKQGSSAREIKKSFRRKAKKIHPDIKGTSNSRENYHKQMSTLLSAYEVLIDPEKKEHYDHSLSVYQKKIRFNYREFLKKRKHDLVSQSQLIFYDLLNSNYEEALELYEHITETNGKYSLELFMDYGDYMDCLFLLAEAYENRGEYIKAFNIYKKLYINEIEKQYFHHFIDEVIERLRNLTCFKMVSIMEPDLVIEYIRELICFNFSKKDNAFFYKKIAEIHCILNEKEQAVYFLKIGLSLDQKLSGVKKLKEKIGFQEIALG